MIKQPVNSYKNGVHQMKRCETSGKVITFENQVSHSHRATRRV
jgi:hypothetical protein